MKDLLALQNFGSFIPGHGGVTDRCDCMFLCAAIIHFYYNAFGEERVAAFSGGFEFICGYHLLFSEGGPDQRIWVLCGSYLLLNHHIVFHCTTIDLLTVILSMLKSVYVIIC